MSFQLLVQSCFDVASLLGELERRVRANLCLLYSVNSLAPYERRVIELLRNSKDKRARKLAKKRVRPKHTHTSDAHHDKEY